jgi:uncharacterized repeat protein (TIGR03803 family)
LTSFSGADGAAPNGLLTDAKGNLFGTTFNGGTANLGTVFEIVKTHHGYASTPTTLVSLCSLPNCRDGANPAASLIAGAKGNLFGTAFEGGNNNSGTGIVNLTGCGQRDAHREGACANDYAAVIALLISAQTRNVCVLEALCSAAVR